MTGLLTCTGALALATARRSGLSEGDMLRLEAHLSGCAECAADARLLDDLAELATGGSGASASAGSSWRSALDRALAGEGPRFAPARARRVRPAALVGVAALAALVLLGIAASRPGAAPDATAAVTREDATPLSASGHLRASAATRITVAHAVLDVEAGTELAWSDARVTLEAGSVSVAVDPGPHLPFVVQTARFTVHVTGTRFEAGLASVRVAEGSVVVRSPEGALLAELHAGETWELLSTAPGPLALDDVERVEATAAAVATMPAPRREEAAVRAERTAADTDVAAEPTERADDRVVSTPAVTSVTASIVGTAEPASERFARAAALEPTDPAHAAEIYEGLEREGGPWGNNALFARASLALAGGRVPEARTLLERYLREHPGGANAEDARGLLETLGEP